MRVRRSPAIVLSLVLGAAALLTVPSAAGSDGGAAKDDVDRTSCSGSSWTRIKVAGIDGNKDRFQVIAAVFSDDDDIWAWKLRHDGDLSAQGEVRARDDIDRSFRVVRTMLDFAGPDDVFFRAENQRTDEVCKIAIDY
jgi:hypothetical protein